MQLSEDVIEEFKKLYFQEYGIKLTRQEVLEYGSRLIRFVKAIYGNNLPKIGLDKAQEKSIR